MHRDKENITGNLLLYRNPMRLKYILTLLLLCLGFGIGTLSATHFIGSTITYECLGGGQYRAHLHYYADCQGLTPNPAPLTVTGFGVGCTAPTATAWTLVSSNDVSFLSPAYPTTCTGGAYPGVRDYHFTSDYNFGGVSCTKYQFSWNECCRNGSNTSIQNAMTAGSTVVTDTLNLSIVGCNSSPVWHNAPPRIATALRSSNFFDLGATDPDGDSLAYSLETPLDGSGNPIVYNLGYNWWNPMGPNWMHTFNEENGLLWIVPNAGANIIASIGVRVTEYRNGQRIGSVLREFEILGSTTFPANLLPAISLPTNPVGARVIGGQIIVPPGGSFCVDFNATDPNTGDATQLSWMSDLPGAAFTDTFGIGPDTVMAVGLWARLCWTAPTSIAAPTGKRFWITAIDTTSQLNNMVAAWYDVRLGDTSLVWPGDADNNLVADAFDLLPIGVNYGNVGTMRSTITNAWAGQVSSPWTWGTPIPGIVDEMFSDCNGDSLVDDNDTLAITLNYGLTHLKANLPVARGTTVDPPFRLVLPDSASVGDTISAPIILGDNSVPAANIYGWAFKLHYDASLIDSSTFWIDFNGSWLANGSTTLDMSRNHPTLSICDAAQVRTNHASASGMGQVATAHFVIIDNIDGKRATLDSASLNVFFTDVKVIGIDGLAMPVDAQQDSMTVYDRTTETPLPIAPDAFVQIYPNPAQDRLTIAATGTEIEEIELISLQGQLLFRQTEIHKAKFPMSLHGFAPGMYFARIQTKSGMTVQRIVIE